MDYNPLPIPNHLDLGRDTIQVTLTQALETFIHLELMGKSNQTIHWYRDRLSAMVQSLGPDRPLVSIMEIDLLEWLSWLMTRQTLYGGSSSRPQETAHLSPYTIQGYVKAARRFFKWLVKKKLIEANPAADLPIPKLPKTSRKGIPEKDLQGILASARNNPRDYAILQFFRATGGRLGGVVSLCLTDLDLDASDEKLRRRVMVREKGEKERPVFLTPTALEALRAWLAVRPECDDPHVFLGHSNGQPWHGLKDRGVYEIVRKYALKSGAKKGSWSPHQWRHRFARNLLQRGLGLAQVSQIMGHSTVKVTVDFYGQFAVDQLQDGYDEFMLDE